MVDKYTAEEIEKYISIVLLNIMWYNCKKIRRLNHMNSLINELVKKLRNVKNEEEAKRLSYELSDTFDEVGITEILV